MAALPYMQLYVSDYLADTAHLTAAQHGAYLLLIFNYWQRGHALNNSNERLTNVARMSNEEWAIAKPILSEFFEIVGDEWKHARIERDLMAVNSKSGKASEAGKASAARRAANKADKEKDKPTNVERTLNHTDTDTDTEVNLKPFAESDKITSLSAEHEKIVFDGSSFQGLNGFLAKWKTAYPAVDVSHELEKASAWLISNPKNKKSQYGRFLNAWLSKAQDRAPARGGKQAAKDYV